MNRDEYIKLAEVENRMWYFKSLHAHIARELRAVFNGRHGLHVLDAGCGTGGLIVRLRGVFPDWKWCGIDFSPLACELARAGTMADIREASITALPFADGTFDAVTTADVICQIDHPEQAFAELFRVLRPGGVAIINLPAYMWMWSYHDDSVQSKHRFTRPEVRALLTRAGLVEQRLTYWNALLFPLVFVRRKLFPQSKGASDVRDYAWPLDLFFRTIMRMEHAWLRLGGVWPWGLSVFAVARKPHAR